MNPLQWLDSLSGSVKGESYHKTRVLARELLKIRVIVASIGLGVFLLLELVGLETQGWSKLLTLVVLYVIGLMVVTAFHRFWVLLARAQHCANGATCGECGAYGLFDVVMESGRIPATCRRCGNRWTIR